VKVETVELSSRDIGVVLVWINQVVAFDRTRSIFVRPQRTAVLRIISAYRIVSNEALLFSVM